MSDEYTPSDEELQEAYEYWAAGCGGSDGYEVERWLTAHDQALREQIASEIEAHIDDDGTDEWFAAIDLAARIARGERP